MPNNKASNSTQPFWKKLKCEMKVVEECTVLYGIEGGFE